eukprot:1655160-Pleurochrysis_carterae.AAC.1
MEGQALRVEELARDDRIRRGQITKENNASFTAAQARERVVAAKLGELRQTATAATVEAAGAAVQAAQAAQAAEATAETPGRSKRGAGTDKLQAAEEAPASKRSRGGGSSSVASVPDVSQGRGRGGRGRGRGRGRSRGRGGKGSRVAVVGRHAAASRNDIEQQTSALALSVGGLGCERQQVLAAMKESIESVVAWFEVEPYRPWEQLEALKLTKGVVHDTGELTRCLHMKLHNGGRSFEDVSAERVLCDVLQTGGQVIHLVVNSSAVALPVSF